MANSSVEKGKQLENYVADQIRAKGIDPKAYRSHGSGNGNREKADIWTSMKILDQNVGFECKNHKTLAIPAWWKQTKKLESLGREPVLVFKQYMEPLGETKVVIYLDTLLELSKLAGGGRNLAQNSPVANETTQNDRELAYALSTLKNAISRVNKLLE